MLKSEEQHITVYEHEWLRTDKKNFRDKRLPNECYKILCEFYGKAKLPYYSLIHNGVQFCQYVGVLKVGRFTIEILPKADRNRVPEDAHWQKVLIEMLYKSGNFPVSAPSAAGLSLINNHILDLYLKLFLDGVEALVQAGLIKKYSSQTGNVKILKGKILLTKHLQRNLIHKERFFTNYSVYGRDHVLNQLLVKTLSIIPQISSFSIGTRAKQLLVHFPDIGIIEVKRETFERLRWDRKSEPYHNVINIARMLLLNFHPSLNEGHQQVLALLFDMNNLWERYVLYSLKKEALKCKGIFVSGKEKSRFWNNRNIIPDIVIRENNKVIIIDTKWKSLKDQKPAIEDVRQMYAYNHHFRSHKSIMLYPNTYMIKGVKASYYLPNPFIEDTRHTCEVMFIDVVTAEGQLDPVFGTKLLKLCLT